MKSCLFILAALPFTSVGSNDTCPAIEIANSALTCAAQAIAETTCAALPELINATWNTTLTLPVGVYQDDTGWPVSTQAAMAFISFELAKKAAPYVWEGYRKCTNALMPCVSGLCDYYRNSTNKV